MNKIEIYNKSMKMKLKEKLEINYSYQLSRAHRKYKKKN